MYDELIKRLRECTAEMNGEKTLWHQAADAIEELQKDLERSKDFEAFWQHEAEEALKKFQVAISNKPLPQLNTLREIHVNPVYEPAPYWTNPEWKAPTPMCTASDVHGFTDEERDLYWKTIQNKSVATGININDLFKSEGET